MTELKPCPFCGSNSVNLCRYSDDPNKQYFVYCMGCGIRFMYPNTYKEIVAREWNRRVKA